MLHVLPTTSPETEAALNQLSMSPESQPLFDAVKRHIAENVEPIAAEFHRLGEGRADRWSWAPGQLELLEVAKNKAKVLVGTDAKILDTFVRASGAGYQRVLTALAGRFMPRMR